MAGVQAFREAWMSADAQAASDFGAFAARQMRYAILWSLFENTAYRNVHSWSAQVKAQYGLYKAIRNIYNPANRLGIFWQAYLMGGALDPGAGDGSSVPSALPIVTDDERHREAIAQVWEWSSWMARKDIMSLWGAVLGDVVLQVVDAPDREKVYLQLVHPGALQEITTDNFGNIKGYIIEEYRTDPENSDRQVRYKEVCEREEGSDAIEYTTYRDDALYPWMGDTAKWTEPYGFVPMVLVKHNDVGLQWGWAEMQPVLSKAREIDDQASELSDQVRKLVDAPWLFTGVSKPSGTVKTTHTAASDDAPEPWREEIPIVYGPAGATATPLVAPLDIAAALEHINGILAELERDLPELQHDIWAGGDTSGRALRLARQRVSDKVLMRRINYDEGNKRALQMAISIAGMRGYDAFRGFSLDSYKAGDLDFSIGARNVFAADPMDDIEQEQAFWTAARTATQTGLSLDIFLRRAQWSEDEIQQVMSSPYYATWLAGQGGVV